MDEAPGAGQSVPAGERGATRIAPGVVAKIASQAAREALRETGREEWVPPRHAMPRATVSLRRAPKETENGAREARIRVAVELDYPSDIGARCRAVRHRVAERVDALAGMHVPEVSVSVERLHSAQSRRAEEGRVR